jgi:hypothetical protein
MNLLWRYSEAMALHSRTYQKGQKGHVCNFLYQSRSCNLNCCTKGLYKCQVLQGKVLHNLKKYFRNRQSANDLRGARLLHENASSHKAAIVREYLKQE